MLTAALVLSATVFAAQGLGGSSEFKGGAPYKSRFRKLVWSDEFRTEGLPDARKWGYEVGYVRNDEKQYYTNARKENARIENGRLIIEGRKDGWDGKPITSASITTEGKFSMTKGRIEVKAKVPGGKGTWPAIWTLGTNIRQVGWPMCGEIDVLEYVGFDRTGVHHNVHVETYNHTKGNGKGTRWDMTPPPTDGFHVYAVDYDKKRMIWSVDGVARMMYERTSSMTKKEWPFDDPQYLILNLAIGGGWGGAQGIDDSIFPARFEIEYVRVYG